MRSLLLVGVVLVAAGFVAWYLMDGEGGGSGDAYDDAPIDAEGEDGGPGLTAAGKKRAAVPAETRGRGWIQGTVTRDGTPVSASIELRHVDSIDPRNPLGSGIGMVMIGRMLDSGVSPKPVLEEAAAEADGRFRFMGLAPGRYEVRAIAADGVMGFTPASLPALGARVEASVELPAGTEILSGRVEHKDGSPYRGLVVATTGEPMAAMFGGGGDVRPTHTDDQGRFKLGGLNPGQVSVSAIVPGVMRVMGAPVTLPYEGEYVLTIDAGGVTTKGRVLSAADETPVAGATVFGGGGDPSTSFSIRSTTSDADGRFALTLPPGRGGGFMVQADGYAAATINLKGGPQDEVTVTLVALGQVSGRVVTKENGTPVEGVTIFARGDSGRGGFPVANSTVTDAEGRYVLANAAPGALNIHALGAGWVSVGYGGQGGGTPFVAEVEPGETTSLDIEVIPGARASGRVTTPGGEPIVGAVVQPSNELGMADMWTALLGMGSSFGASVTDDQGRYEIDVLAPGSNYKITARAPDYPDAVSESFTANAGKTQILDLRMTAPRWLRVRVVDAVDGAPLSGASVALIPDGGGMMVDLAGLMRAGGSRTDAQGFARVGPMTEGKKALRVSAPGYVQRQNVQYEDVGEDAPTLTVELTRGLVIAGRVVVPEGVAVQSVRVTIQSNGRVGRSYFYENAPVQPDGTFRVSTVKEEGSYKVQGNCTWKERRYRAETLVDAGTEDAVLELEEQEGEDLGTLVVNVIDADGKAVPSGRINLSQFGSNSHHGINSDLSGGKATFRSVRPETELWIEVYQVIGGRGALIQGPFSPTAGEIEVRLPAGRTIEGSAVGPDGKAVRGVRVTATAKHPHPTRDDGEEHATAVSGEDGRFTLKNLGELEYELSFTTPKDFTSAPAQTVAAGASNIVVKLRAGLKATLTIVDFAGKPVPGAYAYARAEGNQQNWRYDGGIPRADQDGQIVLRGLDPDASYSLSVNPSESRQDLKVVQRQKWRPRDETIRLDQAWRIAGRVKDQKDRPAIGVWVRARREGTEKWTGSAHTDDSGRFDMRNLDAGRYELRASSSHNVQAVPGGSAQGESAGQVFARAGAENVELVVDLGEKLVVRVQGLKDTVPGMPNATLQPDKGGPGVSGQWESGGRLVFQGVRPGVAYTLWILGLPESRYVHVKGVTIQDGELEVDSKAGGRITGRVRVPEGVPLSQVGVGAGGHGGGHAQAVLDRKTGAFVIDGLPDGTYALHAHAWHDGKSYQGQAQASTGGEAEIELKQR